MILDKDLEIFTSLINEHTYMKKIYETIAKYCVLVFYNIVLLIIM